MTLPILSVEKTLDKLVDHWHEQRSARGTTNPAEILAEAGVRMDDPGLLEYIGFLQEYECAIYEHDAIKAELDEATPIDWRRVASHTAGGAAIGTALGGLYGALLVGSALGGGVLAEENYESTQTDLRAMYIGAGMGAAFGYLIGLPAVVMGLCMYTGLLSSAFYQWDEDSRLTDRIEKYNGSMDQGFGRRVASLKKQYSEKIKSLVSNLDSK